MNKKLIQIKKDIENEHVCLSDIFYLEQHKKEVLTTDDLLLCQWAGITEAEYNNGTIEE